MAKTHLNHTVAIELLAKNVRKYRVEAKMSQMLLAEMLGVDYSQIARVERAKINTSVSMIFLIAEALDIEPAKLLEK